LIQILRIKISQAADTAVATAKACRVNLRGADAKAAKAASGERIAPSVPGKYGESCDAALYRAVTLFR
jgi:hypothetical protein